MGHFTLSKIRRCWPLLEDPVKCWDRHACCSLVKAEIHYQHMLYMIIFNLQDDSLCVYLSQALHRSNIHPHNKELPRVRPQLAYTIMHQRPEALLKQTNSGLDLGVLVEEVQPAAMESERFEMNHKMSARRRLEGRKEMRRIVMYEKETRSICFVYLSFSPGSPWALSRSASRARLRPNTLSSATMRICAFR